MKQLMIIKVFLSWILILLIIFFAPIPILSQVSCDPWTCSSGTITVELIPPEITLCVGDNSMFPQFNVTIIDGSKYRHCIEEIPSPPEPYTDEWDEEVSVTYTKQKVYPMLPPPPTFDIPGTYTYTFVANGISNDPDCSNITDSKDFIVNVVIPIYTEEPIGDPVCGKWIQYKEEEIGTSEYTESDDWEYIFEGVHTEGGGFLVAVYCMWRRQAEVRTYRSTETMHYYSRECSQVYLKTDNCGNEETIIKNYTEYMELPTTVDVITDYDLVTQRGSKFLDRITEGYGGILLDERCIHDGHDGIDWH